MNRIFIWGCSDDLIEITGDATEEFNCDYGHIMFSDGTLINFQYDSMGNWVSNGAEIAEGTLVTKHNIGSPEAIEITEGRDYSEVIEVVGDFYWVAHVTRIVEIRN